MRQRGSSYTSSRDLTSFQPQSQPTPLHILAHIASRTPIPRCEPIESLSSSPDLCDTQIPSQWTFPISCKQEHATMKSQSRKLTPVQPDSQLGRWCLHGTWRHRSILPSHCSVRRINATRLLTRPTNDTFSQGVIVGVYVILFGLGTYSSHSMALRTND